MLLVLRTGGIINEVFLRVYYSKRYHPFLDLVVAGMGFVFNIVTVVIIGHIITIPESTKKRLVCLIILSSIFVITTSVIPWVEKSDLLRVNSAIALISSMS